MNQVCVQRKLITRSAAPLALVLALCAAPAAFAHHSGAMFDQAKIVTITGTVKDYHWSNPHTLIEVMGTNAAGAQVVWNIECSTPNILVRKGWGAHSLKPGDAVSMTAHPMRDGGPAALVMTLTGPGGAVLKDHDY